MKFDLNKLEDAITYMNFLADGNDPLTGMPEKELNLDDPVMIRCFNYVLLVLREVSAAGGYVEAGAESRKRKGPRKEFPYEVLSQFVYRNDKSISYVLKQFAEPVGEENVRRPNPAAVNLWLEKHGYIEKRTVQESGRQCWFPTQKGEDAGLYLSEHGDPAYRYVTIIYSKDAQEFLAENLELIMEEMRTRKNNRDDEL